MPVRIDGLNQLTLDIGRAPAGLEANARAALWDALGWIEEDAKTILRQHADTGQTADSIARAMSGTGGELVGSVGPTSGDPPGSIGLYIEQGRRPGATPPPSAALADWGARHGFDTPGSLFVLARSIGRKGIPARPFMQPAYEKNVDRIVERFAAEAMTVVRQMGGR